MSTPLTLSVIRAFEILSAFNGRRPVLTTTEIAKKTGMNNKTVHRFLLTLEKVGAISRVGRGQFSLGMTLADLGSQVAVHRVLAEAVMKHLEPLSETLNESVQAAVLEDFNIVSIAHIPSRHSLTIGIRVGRRWPAYCTSLGKVLIADMDEGTLDKYLEKFGLERRTSNTITSPAKLKQHLKEVSEQGYAINDQESERGMRGVAVPLKSVSGRTIAAISVSGPTARMPMNTLMKTKNDLEDCASQVVKTLYGGQG